ncbi:hypothetical protein GIS00_15940 [Nakamurella sp. YIM 132087]|uniref:DUF3368 domain-containing protein n=1 Tax=Nakamurella alba TaxID=2665158 RepID=A0A7K1FQ00_9ACTN|nr:hypothetical protein [Nakamurella alba]MTD15429.1 hypothetical protein [Nakamurella alba]
MTGSAAAWVVDTSTYTHLSRAGHVEVLHQVAPGGIIVIPAEVHAEIQNGRDRYPGIAAPEGLLWVEQTVLTEAEAWTQLEVKAALGGGPLKHLGECAVIACALHRGLVAVLDDRAAAAQAELRGIESRDTMWIVIEAWATVFDRDRDLAIAVIDALLDTDMFLPITSGASLFAWAYEEGLLPRD